MDKDLELLRDETCIPIAQALLKEMSSDLLTKGDNQVELTSKGLSLMLDKDLNVTSEASYVPQLILGVLSGLNLTIQSCDMIQPDDARYNIIGGKILSIVSEANVKMGAQTKDETEASFVSVKEKLNELFKEEQLNKFELKYIMDNIFESFTALNNLMSKTIAEGTERMECKILGIESMGDLSLKKLNEILITPKEQ